MSGEVVDLEPPVLDGLISGATAVVVNLALDELFVGSNNMLLGVDDFGSDLALELLDKCLPVSGELVDKLNSGFLTACFALLADFEEGGKVSSGIIPDFVSVFGEEGKAGDLVEPSVHVLGIGGTHVAVVEHEVVRIAAIVSAVTVLVDDGLSDLSGGVVVQRSLVGLIIVEGEVGGDVIVLLAKVASCVVVSGISDDNIVDSDGIG